MGRSESALDRRPGDESARRENPATAVPSLSSTLADYFLLTSRPPARTVPFMSLKYVHLGIDREAVLAFDAWLLDEERAGRKRSRQSVLAPLLEQTMRRIVARGNQDGNDKRKEG